jgi:hypothetical protein
MKIVNNNEYLKVVKLLEDLTPGGSEFYNDPEYCAKWVKEQVQSVPRLMLPIKRENDKLKKDNAAMLEALKELDNRCRMSDPEYNMPHIEQGN